MSNALPVSEPRPARERRGFPAARYRRWPRIVRLCETPVERLVALFGGNADAAAAAIGATSSMLYKRRRAYDGTLPPDRLAEIDLTLKAQGFTLPDGFLTEIGVFDDPRGDR